MYLFLMVLTISSTAGLQVWRTLFDNFAANVIGLEGHHIGMIQSVREIPGFLSLLVVYVMLVLKETRISSWSIVLLGVGVASAGFFPSYAGLMVTTLIMSFGFHYFETTNQSLTLQYFDAATAPIVFGKLRSHAAAANVGVGVALLFLVPRLTFIQMFLLSGVLVILTGLWSFSVSAERPGMPVQRKQMVLRKKYWLYYFLTFMAGARRQIFIAFAVFLLVKKFSYSVFDITLLFLINNIINYFLSPLIGKAIVKFGERSVLTLEYAALVFIFMAYALIDDKFLIGALYIADHIFFNFAIAIRTFFQKIADPGDIAPSMAVGFTINHIAAVVFPVVGGLLWMIDDAIPFYCGAVFSLISLSAVQLISGQLQRHGTTGQLMQKNGA
jgi:hypothetical protein